MSGSKDRFFGAHDFAEREEEIKGSSDRGFGLVFAIFFAIVGSINLWAGRAWWPYLFAAAGVMLVLAYLFPRLLTPFNRAWMKFGLILFAVISPVVLSVIFYLVITPIALTMRALGKDPLRLKKDAVARTYWISRTPPGPAPDSLKGQF